MTRLGRASALLGVFAGDYAILMLINGQLTDFDVSAGVCDPFAGDVLLKREFLAGNDSDRVTCRDLADDLGRGRLVPGRMICQRTDRMIRAADRSMSNLLPQTVIRTCPCSPLSNEVSSVFGHA
jgi:hypothetical protein